MSKGLRAWTGFAALAVGFGLVAFGLSSTGAQSVFLGLGALSAQGLGSLLQVGFDSFLTLNWENAHRTFAATSGVATWPTGARAASLGSGLVLWLLGAWLSAQAFAASRTADEAPSNAVGAPLNPKLKRFSDFSFGALAAYSAGIFVAELGLIASYTLLVGGGRSIFGARGAADGLSPVSAFSVALALAVVLAFAGGVAGAWRARRLASPEATLAILYAGLPIPIVLTASHHVPSLILSVGARLREVSYLASLLGENRPELGYWLVFLGLVIALFLGANFGFVATSSGRFDLRASFELFVARRHVAVFRPQLLLGVFGVLIFGILPPLVIYFMVRAAAAAVERTRIRILGERDPLLAAKALHELKARAQAPTEMMTALSVGGVGVGVMALIIVLSVMSGFEEDLQQKILGTRSHGLVLKYADAMPEYPEVMEKISSVPGVAGMTPFILNEVMVSTEGNISGAIVKGVDPSTVGVVMDLPKFILPGGSLEGLTSPSSIPKKKPPTLNGAMLDERDPSLVRDPLIDVPAEEADVVLPGIVLGRELASSLKVTVSDRVNVVSPLGGEMGPTGPMPKSRPFRVAAIFYSGMFEHDSKFIYIELEEAKRFFGMKGATGIELKVHDIDDARRIMKAISAKLEGYPYRTKDWGEMNSSLFAALRLEKLVMAIILSIIVIVAAGLIVATVIMLVLEKRKEIAVLKALGVSDGGIVKIFLGEGLQIGVAGGLLGLVSGLAWCFFIESVGIKLDPQIYYIPKLPVRIELFQTALAVIIAVLVTFLASIYPALKASQVEPVEGLKSE